jgi:hypothetical protein
MVSFMKGVAVTVTRGREAAFFDSGVYCEMQVLEDQSLDLVARRKGGLGSPSLWQVARIDLDKIKYDAENPIMFAVRVRDQGGLAEIKIVSTVAVVLSEKRLYLWSDRNLINENTGRKGLSVGDSPFFCDGVFKLREVGDKLDVGVAGETYGTKLMSIRMVAVAGGLRT